MDWGRLGTREVARGRIPGSVRVKENAYARETLSGCRPGVGGCNIGSHFCIRHDGAPVAGPRHIRRRRLAGAEDAVLRPLPRVAAGVRGALGLAFAAVLPLHGSARLLT